MKKIVSRGRVLGKNSSEFARMLEGSEGTKTFTLKSGRQAKFLLTVVLSGEIESRTFVDPAVNGRDQSLLTPESVSDISRTIKLQQFFPAIGRMVGERIEVLDGSRRRAACIFNETKFEILVTKDEISLADARQLAIDIQTAREHTLRELGKRFEVMYGKSMTKEEIARAENISKAKVTRAFQAAAVPDEMIAVFPVASDLALPDYQLLLQISEDANAKSVPIEELVDTVRERIAETEGAKEDKAKILAIFKAESKSLKPAPVKSVVVEKLRDFSDRRQYARKKSDPKKRVVAYEFSRLPSEVQTEIDEAIKKIIGKMSAPQGFQMGDAAELKAVLEDGGIARVKKQDLGSDEISTHLEAGKLVTKLALDWQNRIKFTLDHNFSITSVNFADELLEQNSDIDSEDVAQRLDADFFLLTSEISCLVDALVNALGGEAKQ